MLCELSLYRQRNTLGKGCQLDNIGGCATIVRFTKAIHGVVSFPSSIADTTHPDTRFYFELLGCRVYNVLMSAHVEWSLLYRKESWLSGEDNPICTMIPNLRLRSSHVLCMAQCLGKMVSLDVHDLALSTI